MNRESCESNEVIYSTNFQNRMTITTIYWNTRRIVDFNQYIKLFGKSFRIIFVGKIILIENKAIFFNSTESPIDFRIDTTPFL